ncbi:MAG: hypothetical protein D6750_02925 [Bacteroidetes bacterium]|nr:MAG: hypothetical protein D6750_02925 [Bacteroidota bacterium]
MSGDFFWSHGEKRRLLFAVGDAISHGVFGALLSVIFMQQLRHLVLQNAIWATDRLVEEADRLVNQLFSSTSDRPMTIDAIVGALDLGKRRLSYVSLKGKGYLVRGGQIQKLESHPFSFGERLGGAAEEKEIALEPGDRLYFLSDGLANQMCEKKQKPLGSKEVAELLLRLQSEPIEQQREALLHELDRLRGAYPQSDDMVVVGMEIV